MLIKGPEYDGRKIQLCSLLSVGVAVLYGVAGKLFMKLSIYYDNLYKVILRRLSQSG